jgi:hypothetical protein
MPSSGANIRRTACRSDGALERRLPAWLAGAVRELLFRIRKLLFGRGNGHRSRPACLRRFLTAAALLTQVQLFWLAAIHYHPDVSDFQWASSVADSPSSHGIPVDSERSCPFCQVARHNPSSPPVDGQPSLASVSAGRTTPLVLTPLPAAPQVRLAGRDPPLSFLANC